MFISAMSTCQTNTEDTRLLSTDAAPWFSVRRKLQNVKRWHQALTKDQHSIRVMRFAVGVTLAMAIALGFDWPLAFLTPVLVAVILAMPLPAPSLKTGLTNMLYTVAAFGIAVVFTLFLLPYPLIYIPMLGLALFQIYYLLNRAGPFWFVLMALLAILILPLLGKVHEALALGFAMGFVWSGWLTVLMIWLAHLLVPDPVGGPPLPARPGFQAGYSPAAALAALKSTIVVLPIAVVFITFDWISQLLVLVFAAIFSLSPDIVKGRSAGVNSIISTVIGGLSAAVYYAFIVAVPEFFFFLTLMLFSTLVFGLVIFSGKSYAKYYASAFTAMFILVNSSTAEGADFTSNFLLRLLLILLATVYVVISLMVLERYWPSKQNT